MTEIVLETAPPGETIHKKVMAIEVKRLLMTRRTISMLGIVSGIVTSILTSAFGSYIGAIPVMALSIYFTVMLMKDNQEIKYLTSQYKI